jgi:hypothetical protein
MQYSVRLETYLRYEYIRYLIQEKQNSMEW